MLARLIGQKLGEALGQQIVVDNRPGANGNIGSDAVAKSAADGYTLLLAADGTIVINPSLYSNLPFNPEKDFVPIYTRGAGAACHRRQPHAQGQYRERADRPEQEAGLAA